MVSPFELIEFASKAKDLHELLKLKSADLADMYVRAIDETVQQQTTRLGTKRGLDRTRFKQQLAKASINLYRLPILADDLTLEIGEIVREMLLVDPDLISLDLTEDSAKLIVEGAHRRYERLAFTEIFPDGVRVGLLQVINILKDDSRHQELVRLHEQQIDALKLLLELHSRDQAETESLAKWDGSPFPGLRAFSAEQAPIFFGRELEIRELLERLSNPDVRFLAVIGASGSGKSSLVAAGLIPRLSAGEVPSSDRWAIAQFSPDELGNGNPFAALAHGLKTAGFDRTRTRMAFELSGNPVLLDDLVIDQDVLLFVDQFEELFNRVSDGFRTDFINLLAYAVTVPGIRTIVTLRSDFFAHCLAHQQLAELLRVGSYPLGAPGIGALFRMIEQPAKLAGLSFDNGLPERILKDTGSEPGSLALMAFALDELYKLAEIRGGHCLTFEDYDVLGGVEKAIGTRADNIFAHLEEDAQDVLPHVFRELVELDERGTATRQRALLEQVTRTAPEVRLVGALTDARLLVQSRSEDNQPIVEVAHEALFRSWPRLAEWVGTAQDDLRLRRQVRQAVMIWERNERSDDFLWTGQRLKNAQEMVRRFRPELSEAEREFLRSEVDRLEERLKELTLDHAARASIGEQLHTLGDTRPGVSLRPDGLPDINWCFVQAGHTIIGQKSPKTFAVGAFFIAKYPITYVQFKSFLEASDGFTVEEWWMQLATGKRQVHEQRYKFENHPRDNVTWFEAVAFCRWLSAKLPQDGWPQSPHYEDANWIIRLPTEWEWQLAATSGNPSQAYPWGDEWDMTRTNTAEAGLNRTVAVGLFPSGTSSAGIQDLCGNIRQWCQNEYYDISNTQIEGRAPRVVRGSSWDHDQHASNVNFRGKRFPNRRGERQGFRVACVPIIT